MFTSMANAVDLRFIANQRTIPWKNTSGSSCPAYGIFEITGYTLSDSGRVVVTGRQCTDTSKPFAFNGNHAVGINQHGQCTLDDPVIGATSATPSVGSELGPIVASWLLSSSGSGYLALSSATDSNVLVIRKPGGGFFPHALFRGIANEPWDSGDPLDITRTVSYFTTETTPIEWSNTHNHVFDTGADVVGLAVKESGTWQALIISAEETHTTCDEAALTLDGGDADPPYDP